MMRQHTTNPSHCNSVLQQALAAFTSPSQPSKGLPAGAYTDADFYHLECQSVWQNHWVFVGFAHELQQVGDSVPITVAGKPILLLKNANATIVAFHNVCSHRCLQLIDKPKNVGKLIRCPYHAWAYDLQGALKASPHFGGTGTHGAAGFDPLEHGLSPVRLHQWHDWLFINLSGTATDFEIYAQPLIDRLADIDLKKAEPVALLDFGKIKTNWKFIMENFIEPYHVQFVHRTTTSQPLSDHYTVVDGVCLGSAVDLAKEAVTSDNLAVSSRYLTLFPNFIIGCYFPDQLGVYLNTPLATDKMTQKRVIYTTSGQQFSDSAIDNLKSLWFRVHQEDHTICERMQCGRASPVAAQGGLLSPHWEVGVRAFQELIVQSIQTSLKE